MKKLMLLLALAFLITGCASNNSDTSTASATSDTNKYPHWVRGASLNLKGDGLSR